MAVLYILIPFYNEAATLEECVGRVLAAPLPPGVSRHLVFVDDRSTDGTGAIAAGLVDRLREGGGSATLLRHEINRGKGAALQTGFDQVLATASDADLVIIQDADLEYDPNDYGALLDPVLKGNAEAAFGTRFGEHFRPEGLFRRIHAFGNRTLTRFSNLMTGVRVSDMECCYKLFTLRALRTIRPLLTENRFGIEPQIAAALARHRIHLVERPVKYDPRDAAAGKKIGWRDGVSAFWVVARERFRRAPKPPAPAH